MAAWAESDDNNKAETLEREFEASMQAAMAAAVAIDAFYSVLQAHVELPPSLTKLWREKRTARYSQVTEVLRRGFCLKPKETRELRERLKLIYRFRDLAVHPSGKTQAAILHPELNVGVEWRFAYFRAANAEGVVNSATGIIWQLASYGTSKNEQITKYAKALRERMLELFPSGHPLEKAAQQSGEGSGNAEEAD